MSGVTIDLHLRAAGVSLVLHSADDRLPSIVHWGADLGADLDLPSLVRALRPATTSASADSGVRFSVVAQESEAYSGRPGLTGSRGTGSWSPRLRVVSVEESADGATIEARDDQLEVTMRTTIRLDPYGVLQLRHAVRNDGLEPYTVRELATVVPVPGVVGEVLDLAGRWALERQPQRRPTSVGTWLRELRHGRTGFEAPLVTVAGTPGFGNRHGEVWGIHLGWSGNARTWYDQTPDGQRSLGAAELLGPAGLIVAPGTSYETPLLYGSWSGAGLDGLADRFHDHVRARPSHPSTPRPVVFNTWEAVYFDQSLEALTALADRAAQAGAERFVLDDGWFLGRRDATAGLGDWEVDPGVWPQGLTPLIDHVLGLGMDFGLWVEPEMVNPDSELLRAHPDWALAVSGHEPITWRQQLVLDLSRPEVFDHLLTRLDALLAEHRIAYLKWDHNRDLMDAGGVDGQEALHDNVLAVYRLLDALRARHPGVEIESCSSGGARVDLGILARTDRVWGSDSIDALDRQAIQRWTSLLLPPELVGSHVGAPRAHTTGRVLDLPFRGATALFGSLGIEWDVSRATDDELAALSGVVAAYRELRPLLHSGRVVHADLPGPCLLHGVVAPDGGSAVFCYAQLASPPTPLPGPVRLPGLRGDVPYLVDNLVLPAPSTEPAPPRWLPEPLTLTGSVLATVGLALPVVKPAQAVLVTLRDARAT
jgi:alpha-galactosidase